MNHITLYVEQYFGENELSKNGLHFNDIVVVKLLIDGADIEDSQYFQDGIIYFDELEASTKGSGNYLIFTCGCGIAEDGGWEGVSVTIDDDEVRWLLEVGDHVFKYTFSKSDYLKEVESIRSYLGKCDQTLEPTTVVFPDGFER
jgi:hypothetical protein